MSRMRATFNRLKSETGTSLIEVTVASAILIVVMAGLMGMASVATSITENQGHLGARTTEYSVDKMEQLLELTYGDVQSNTTVFPSVNIGGSGFAAGGSSDPAAPVVGYTDYLDANGNVLCTVGTPCTATPPTTWFYKRVWKVANCGVAGQCATLTPNLKQITATTIVKTSFANAQLSRATVSAFKTNCPAGC
jgi:hypothetical protein